MGLMKSKSYPEEEREIVSIYDAISPERNLFIIPKQPIKSGIGENRALIAQLCHSISMCQFRFSG